MNICIHFVNIKLANKSVEVLKFYEGIYIEKQCKLDLIKECKATRPNTKEIVSITLSSKLVNRIEIFLK